MNNNFLLPPHFPWGSTSCLPQKIVKTIPRDIDDLHVITHCDDELYAPFGDFKGPLGFGRYDNGQTRGNYGVHQDTQDAAPSFMPTKSDGGSDGTKPVFEAAAAARRSTDPGVIELMVQALPSSIEGNGREFSPNRWRSSLLADPDHGETFARLPFSWKNEGNALQDDIGHAQSQMTIQNSATGCHLSANDVEFLRLKEAQLIAQERRNIALSCSSKWNISVKAGGVSSRSSLFPIPTVLDSNSDNIPQNVRKVLRPMLCAASLPQTILTGETVSMERALELDNQGLAYSLGSYDCRVVDKLSNPKKDFRRLKKVEVGRNRLVWSNIIQADDPFFPTTRSKVSYNSLITGQKLDEKKNRRQTEIKVGVRMSGKLLVEEAIEDQPVAIANSRKRKHTTRQVENETPTLKRTLVPESRTDEEIDLAFTLDENIASAQKPFCADATKNATNNSDVVNLDTGDTPACVEKQDIISSLMKLDQKKSAEEKKRKGSSSQSVSVRPRFACVPLEDGLLRTVCLQAGNMTRLSANQIIQEAIMSESRQVCSICWSDEGDDEKRVLTCVDCGLSAHSFCCHDKGELLTNGSTNGNSARHWRCAVCKHFTGTKSKRRRALKMPSRFDDCETNESFLHTSNGDDSKDHESDTSSPSCSLCPHRGGAMSQIDAGSDKWVHEVCRVWGGDSKNEVLKRSPLSRVCALCGTGGMGLTRCAARGCFVSFHPMCALLASKMEANNQDGRKRRNSRHNTDQNIEDTKLCNEYTLQLVQVSRPIAADDDNANEEDTDCNIVPIAFCGLHNPRRDPSHFGCLPDGKVVKD